MAKERLEEIKGQAQYIDLTIKPPINLVKIKAEDFHWLIEQANRVHELEEDNENLQILSNINRKEHMRIHEQNKRYRVALEEIITLEEYNNMPNFWHDEGDFYDYLENLARKALEGDLE